MPGANSNDILKNALDVVVHSVEQAGSGAGGYLLQPEGMKLFGLLAIISLAWMGIRVVLEEGDVSGIFGNLMRTLIMIGLTYWFLTPEGYNLVFKQGIGGSLEAIAGMMHPGGGTVSESITAAVSQMIGHIAKLSDVIRSWTGESDPDALDYLLTFFSNLLPMMFMLAAIIFLFFAAAVYFVMALVSLVMMHIALALGPIFIPWLLIPYTSFLFDGWLRFLIVAAMYKVVGAMIVGAGASVMSGTAAYLSQMGQTATTGEGLISTIALAMVALTIAYLMAQVPSIAQGLISGSANVSMGRAVSNMIKGGGRAGGQIGGGITTQAGKPISKLGEGISKMSGSSAIGQKIGGAISQAGNRMSNYGKTGDLKNFVGKGRKPGD